MDLKNVICFYQEGGAHIIFIMIFSINFTYILTQTNPSKTNTILQS